MYAEISAAISSAKTALEIAKAANGLANYNELVAAVSEVNSKLMAATAVALASQEKQAELAEQLAALKEELRSLRDWKSVAKNYTLQAVGVKKEHFAQVYKPAIPTSTARHWACTKCFREQKLYILNAHERHCYKCPNCGTEIAPIIPGGMLAPIDSAYSSGDAQGPVAPPET
jgi:hypothetical protein